jgi:small redox-active disulfide protein 2
MTTIQILGTGCRKCAALRESVEAALKASGVEATVEKVEDINQIVNFGVMSTPALVVDGKVQIVGRVPTPSEITKLLPH